MYEVKPIDGYWVVFDRGVEKGKFEKIQDAAVFVDDLRREARNKTNSQVSANSKGEEVNDGNK